MMPIYDWVKLEMEKPPEKTGGGILLPQSAQGARGVRVVRYGKVLAAGPGSMSGGTFVETPVREGMRVMVLENYERAEPEPGVWIVPAGAIVARETPATS